MERGRGDAVRRMRAGLVALAVLSAIAPVRVHAAGAATVRAADVTVESTMTALAAPITGLAATPTGKGYWRAGADGGVLTAGDAPYYGSATSMAHDTIVAIVATRTGHGYWLTDRRGAGFPFRAPAFHGSKGGHQLNLPIVGMAATPDGTGYWL